MNFEVTILGSGAATPSLKRGATSQLVNIHDQLNLIDCGEGTQMQMRRFGVKFQRIANIFISHLHGDHYLGLVGLMSSMHLLGRKKPLNIFGPKHLKELITLNLKYSDTYLDFHWEFTELDLNEKTLILDEKSYTVHAFPLKHRIACHGFLFTEKPRQRKIRKDAIERFELTIQEIIAIKNGEPFVMSNGRVLGPDDVSELPEEPKSYAYCSDTAFSPKVIESVRGCDTIYHESTFLEEHVERAAATFHSTARQAATVAFESEAKQLILGHFSTRYQSDEDFVKEASEIFSNVAAARDGLTFHV
jgi:ribonuclease Z